MSCRTCNLVAVLLLNCGLIASSLPGWSQEASSNLAKPEVKRFPRLMGMNIGRKHYDDENYQRELAKLDYVVLGFYKGWNPAYGMERVVRNIKAANPKILVGQYTVLNEVVDDRHQGTANKDVLDKIDAMNWWARTAAGDRVQWTTMYSAWDINFTEWAEQDSNGQRFPQWLADRNKKVFFDPAPFDIWYLDNMMNAPYVKKADWNRDGKDDAPTDPEIGPGYRRGQRLQMDRIREIKPQVMLMGNVTGDLSESEWVGQLEGAFLEGVIGLNWSMEKWAGWEALLKRYRAFLKNTREPHLVGFNVQGKLNDYPLFRYGYTTCLLDDGYYCYTDVAVGYSSVPWFDEFDIKLGAATSKPEQAWKDGVWRRDFENGVVLVNPQKTAVTVELEAGLSKFEGRQDSKVNDGQPAKSLTLPSRDGIVLIRR